MSTATATPRLIGPAALLAAGVAGLSWASTFDPVALAAPVLAPVVAMAVADRLTAGRPAVRAAALLLTGAAAAVAALLLAGAGPADVAGGVLSGWRRTLESTLPAHADARLVAFVPAATVLAGMLGVEWARRGAGAAATLAPSAVLLLVAQLVRPAEGLAALGTAVGYGAAAAAVLLAGRRRPAGRVPVLRRVAELGPSLGAVLVVGGLLAWAAGGVTLPGRDTWSLQSAHTPETRALSAADPLSTLADRLLAGDAVAFTADPQRPVDRWPLAVLDRYDGVTWTSSGDVRTLGTELPPQPPAVASSTASARIADLHLDGPWLPTQERLRSADGIRPLVDPATGVLLRGDDPPGSYTLRWDDVQVDRAALASAAVDAGLPGAVALDSVPAGIAELTRSAVGPGVGATVPAALLLEKWMRDNYRVATGADLPTGHSYAQLLTFLTGSKRGTSEQFATAYAVMARSIGIPTRVVVGYRDDGSGTVHQADALAWPEIAVAGIGWVPLDPTGGASGSGTGRSELSRATQAARDTLPSPSQVAAAGAGPAPTPAGAGPGRFPWWVLAVIGAAIVLAGSVVPLAKLVRRARRRRPPPRAAVVGAWLDVRDALRDHGVPVPPGTTVRELAGTAPVDAADLHALADCVDAVLWTGPGAPADPASATRAWAAAGRIRATLRRAPLRRRVRAAYAVRTLRRDRAR